MSKSPLTVHVKAIRVQVAGEHVIRYGKTEKEISGGERETTNNRMELRAAIEALNALKRPCKSQAVNRQHLCEGRDHQMDIQLAEKRLADCGEKAGQKC